MQQLLAMLQDGDMRTTGKSEEVVQIVLREPNYFPQLFAGLSTDDPGLRLRSADALEKISYQKPELLVPHKKKLIEIAQQSSQQEVQWHVAQMLSYIELSAVEASTVMKLLNNYIFQTKSNIVKVFSLQAMTDIALQHFSFLPMVKKKIVEMNNMNIPSIKARCRKLQKQIEKHEKKKSKL